MKIDRSHVLAGLLLAGASACAASEYDVAAIVWPAYQPEPRWAELGIFGDGKGEWQNVYECKACAKPLWGYENEADPNVVARKIDAATAAGVNVFIYDWYWYGGRPFLEDALNEGFLKAPNRGRMKFYVMWANHDVNQVWNNKVPSEGKSKILWPAKVTDEDWPKMVARWIGYFREPNYYKIDGKPVFWFYHSDDFVLWDGAEKAQERMAYFRAEVAKAGFPGLHVQISARDARTKEGLAAQVKLMGAESTTVYNWVYRTWDRIFDTAKAPLSYRQWGDMSMFNMMDAARWSAAGGAKFIPVVTIGFDNSSRYPANENRRGITERTPEAFEGYARQVKDWVDRAAMPGERKLVIVNSWNEWTEDSYLEPDDRFGYGYLDALRRVFADAASAPRPSFEADFSSATSNVEVIDYEGRTPPRFAEKDSRPAVTFISRVRGESADTKWGVKTRPFAVTGTRAYALLLEMDGTLPTGANKPGSRICWLAADGKPLQAQDALGKTVPLADMIRLPAPRRDGGVVRAVLRGTVPAQALSAFAEVSVDWPDLPDGQSVSIRRLAYFEGGAGGQVDLGDGDAPTLEMLTDSPSSDLRAPIRFRLVDPNGIDWDETAFRIDGARVAPIDLLREDDVFVHSPTNAWAEDSIHCVEVVTADLKGNAGTDCGFVAFTRKRAAHPRCTVRDDGVLLKDGAPFFPLGWSRVQPCKGNGYDLARGVAEMKANGMNLAHTYLLHGKTSPSGQREFDELVAACEKQGVVLHAEPSDRNPGGTNFLPLAERRLFRALDYRAPIFWGIGDDTSWHLSVDDLKYVHRCCKAIDPAALTVSADVAMGPSVQIPYVPHFDLLFIENYPIRAETPQDDEMAKSARIMDDAWASVRASGMAGRSVIAIPQAFRGWKSWKRLPTAEEIRCQAYLAIACGARGLCFYASTGQVGNSPEERERLPQPHFGPLDSPETKASFFALTREISALEPSLVSRDAPRQPAVTVVKGPAKNVLGGDSVRCLLKEDGLLVLASSAHLPVTAEIRLPSGAVLTRELDRFAGWAERTGK